MAWRTVSDVRTLVHRGPLATVVDAIVAAPHQALSLQPIDNGRVRLLPSGTECAYATAVALMRLRHLVLCLHEGLDSAQREPVDAYVRDAFDFAPERFPLK